MISHGKDVKIFSGNANPKLADEICKLMGTKLGEAEVGTFSDGEVFVSLYETVRGSDVFVVQSTCGAVNNNLMELLIMIDALKRASAGRITAVIHYFGYARQDRKAKARDPITAKLVANMLTAAGGGFEGAFAQFTSWMQPFGNGGSSFPSGHTAAACSVFILTLACDVCLKWNRRRTLVWALCWAYVAFMALCRLVIGRHYLSDTLAAAFVMLLLYLGMRKTKWYRAGARELTAPGT